MVLMLESLLPHLHVLQMQSFLTWNAFDTILTAMITFREGDLFGAALLSNQMYIPTAWLPMCTLGPTADKKEPDAAEIVLPCLDNAVLFTSIIHTFAGSQ
eukprot:8187387-Ditylum_brightwellii.AAC.1